MADEDGAAPELALPPPPPPPPPLSYPEMILEAIDALDNDKGSNKTAISGYIKRKYGANNLPINHTSLLTINLGRMKRSGEVVFSRNNYFRPSAPAAAATAAPASLLQPDWHTYPTVTEDDFFGIEEDVDDGWLLVLAHPVVLPDADANGCVPAPALGMAANDFAVSAPTPGAAADDDIDVPAPVPVVVVTTEATARPVKRGRGRRPSKPKDVVAEDYGGAPADAVAVPAKRGRVRPPKPKDPVAAEASVVAVADAAAVPAKPRRGRPPKPKDPVPVAEASVVAADAAAVPAKRGRGRPPKPKDPANLTTSGEPTATLVTIAHDDAPVVERGSCHTGP